MKNVLYNYSNLQKRDQKIYSIAGYGLSGGMSVNFAKVVVPIALIIIIIGLIIGSIFGVNAINPFGGNWNWRFLVFIVILGNVVGLALWNIQFSGYRLYQYLIAYIKPKKVYTNEPNISKREFKLHNFTIKATIKNIL